ncbi:hypothetical protein [Candidatus Spongiihabitans sp.]|uniref:hypothetical protein n=1 Tax=Candidatus Spongiihabitans sp. TaxID=3101308 RepID=UPI003C6F39F7
MDRKYQFGMLKLAFDNVESVENEMGLFDFDADHVIKHPDKLSGQKIRIPVGRTRG